MVGNKRTPGHQMVRRLTPKLTPRHSRQTLSSNNNVRAGAKMQPSTMISIKNKNYLTMTRGNQKNHLVIQDHQEN